MICLTIPWIAWLVAVPWPTLSPIKTSLATNPAMVMEIADFKGLMIGSSYMLTQKGERADDTSVVFYDIEHVTYSLHLITSYNFVQLFYKHFIIIL